MTYLQFHFVFTIPLFLVVLFANRKISHSFSTKSLTGVALLLFLAISYTTPWDSYLIHEKIWTYPPGSVVGTLFGIPFEEYFFFIVQTMTGCFFTSWLLQKNKGLRNHPMKISLKNVAFCLVSLLALGLVYFFSNPGPEMRYLFLVTFWALPILVLQWSTGFPVLAKQAKTWALGVILLTSYFCMADSIAIAKGIWTFPENTISGVQIFNALPVEEALFFLFTNLMVVQGYILFTTVDFKKFKFSFQWGF